MKSCNREVYDSLKKKYTNGLPYQPGSTKNGSDVWETPAKAFVSKTHYCEATKTND